MSLCQSSKSSFNKIKRTKKTYATSKPTIGFIGLGQMGFRMANNVSKSGHSLIIFDVVDSACKNFSSAAPNSVVIAASPKEVAERADIVVTVLPSSPHVLEVYKGENGLLAGSKKNQLFIDASTIDPVVCAELHENVKSSGGSMVDAPVSGGINGARDGTLSFMVGGENSAFDQAKPLLETMGKSIVHCGKGGNGQVAKVCNNLILGITMVGVSEAMNLGVKLGIDPNVLAKIVNTSSGRCWSSDTYNPVPGILPNVPSSNGYQGGFQVNLMHKDLGLALSASQKLKEPLPLGANAYELYTIMQKNGYGNLDFSSVYKFLNSN